MSRFEHGPGRLSTELLEQVFGYLDARTALLVLPRVCRRWKDVCAGVVVVADFSPNALASGKLASRLATAAARTAAVRSLAARVAGARRADLSARGSKGSYLTDGGLEAVCGLGRLAALNLRNCKFVTDAGLAHVGRLRGLAALNLRSCKGITDRGLAHVAHLQQLASLVLHGCDGVTDAGQSNSSATEIEAGVCVFALCSLASPHVRLHPGPLRTCGAARRGVAWRSGVSAIENGRHSSPSIERLCVTLAGLSHVGSLHRLNSLDLSYTRVTDAGLARLRPLQQPVKAR